MFKKLICGSFWKFTEQEKLAYEQKVLKDNIEPTMRKF